MDLYLDVVVVVAVVMMVSEELDTGLAGVLEVEGGWLKLDGSSTIGKSEDDRNESSVS
jgi:hypothetical protein